MENYQTVGVAVSVIGLILGLIVAFSPLAVVGGIMLLINFFTLMLSVMKVKPRDYSITVAVLGFIGNIFLLIPAFMADSHKKRLQEVKA
jgi:hypothetical protein